MRSVVVVLPASMCAIIPIFRVFASIVSASVEAGLVAVAVLIAFLISPKHVASGTDRCPASTYLGGHALPSKASAWPRTGAADLRSAREPGMWRRRHAGA